MAAPIDPTNRHMVGATVDGTVTILMPPARLTRAEALTFAAWIVAIADTDDEFDQHLQAVRST